MIARLTNEDILLAIDDLVDRIGVREDGSLSHYSSVLRSQGREACAQAVAERLGLPVRVSLSEVQPGSGTAQAGEFRTSALAPVGRGQQGTAGISAQVSIPADLPVYGTPGLCGYVVKVRVQNVEQLTDETYVALMAHELSHVLLASLLHPKKDSELHVDLVPLLLGFRAIIRKGRKSVRTSSTSGFDGSSIKTTTTTTTTTYGYLPDAQFDFACQRIDEIAERRVREKKQVLSLSSRLQGRCRTADTEKEKFFRYRDRLDRHYPRRMAEADARRISALHALGYTQMWEDSLFQSQKLLKGIEGDVRATDHYWPATRKKLDWYSGELRAAIASVDAALRCIKADVSVMRRYVGLWFRVCDKRHRS